MSNLGSTVQTTINGIMVLISTSELNHIEHYGRAGHQCNYFGTAELWQILMGEWDAIPRTKSILLAT